MTIDNIALRLDFKQEC